MAPEAPEGGGGLGSVLSRLESLAERMEASDAGYTEYSAYYSATLEVARFEMGLMRKALEQIIEGRGEPKVIAAKVLKVIENNRARKDGEAG